MPSARASSVAGRATVNDGRGSGITFRPKASSSSGFSAIEEFKRVWSWRKKSRLTFQKETPPEEDRTWFGILASAVRSSRFELFFTIAIVANAALVGFQTQYAASNPEDPYPFEVEAAAYTFAFLFAVELLLRMAVGRRSFFVAGEWQWNWFDTVLVACSLLEVGVHVVGRASGSRSGVSVGPGGQGGSDAGAHVLKFVRATRLLRVLRIVRVLRFVVGLRTLVFTIICTLKSLVWSLVLLVVLFYGFGIILTQAATDHLAFDAGPGAAAGPCGAPEEEELAAIRRYFGGLARTMFTLFQSVTGGVSWDDVVGPLGRVGWPWVALFTAYIVFTCFAVLNVVTSKFCQSAIESAQKDQLSLIHDHLENREAYLGMVRRLFKALDSDNDNLITLDEFQDSLENEEMVTYLNSLGLSTDDAMMLFKLIDVDGTHSIDIEEFMMGCLRLRGNAKSIDVATLMCTQKALGKKVREIAQTIEAVAGEQRRVSGYLVQPALAAPARSGAVAPVPLPRHFETHGV